jgi:hypothetical protein
MAQQMEVEARGVGRQPQSDDSGRSSGHCLTAGSQAARRQRRMHRECCQPSGHRLPDHCSTFDCEPTMLGGDPDCLRRAAYWYAQGVLEVNPEPGAPAPPVSCWVCSGIQYFRSGNMARYEVCSGAGDVPLVAQAAALVGAQTETCD